MLGSICWDEKNCVKAGLLHDYTCRQHVRLSSSSQEPGQTGNGTNSSDYGQHPDELEPQIVAEAVRKSFSR